MLRARPAAAAPRRPGRAGQVGRNARLAHQAGDTAGEKYWSGLVAEIDEMIFQAVHAGFEYFQREAQQQPPQDYM